MHPGPRQVSEKAAIFAKRLINKLINKSPILQSSLGNFKKLNLYFLKCVREVFYDWTNKVTLFGIDNSIIF